MAPVDQKRKVYGSLPQNITGEVGERTALPQGKMSHFPLEELITKAKKTAMSKGKRDSGQKVRESGL